MLILDVNDSEWVPNAGSLTVMKFVFFGWFFDTTAPQWARVSLFTGFLDPTQRRATVGRTPLDE